MERKHIVQYLLEMNEKISFVKNNTELANKILLLYSTIFDFEKRKNKQQLEINSQKKDEKTNKTVSENTRSS
jgi:hypothetical protein